MILLILVTFIMSLAVFMVGLTFTAYDSETETLKFEGVLFGVLYLVGVGLMHTIEGALL